MSTHETLTQEQMEEQITNFLIRSFILSGDISDVQPSYIKKKLKIDISESDLSYKKMMVYETLIKTEIEAQLDYDNSTPKGEKDEAKAFEKVYKKLAKFDFDKYEDMSIEELRELLIVFDDYGHSTGETEIKTPKLIEDNIERACVGVYALLKGGTCLEYDDKDRSDKSDNVSTLLDKLEASNVDGLITDAHKLRIKELLK